MFGQSWGAIIHDCIFRWETILMKMKLLTVAVLSALGVAACGVDDNAASTVVRSVEFTETPAPASTDEIAKTYSKSAVKVTYEDGRVKETPLA
jgi:ABC-type glycerol-3-phosphate transport system substrate-binding protein